MCRFHQKPKITPFQKAKAKVEEKRKKEAANELIKSIINWNQPDPALKRRFHNSTLECEGQKRHFRGMVP